MQTENENIIGKRMKELRGNMSQRQAASCVGMWAQNWNVYESGQSIPGAEVIIKICQYFGVSSDWLLGLSNVRSAADALAPSSAPTSKTVPMQKVFTPKSSTHEVDLLAEVRKLKARVKALEDSSDHRSFACG